MIKINIMLSGFSRFSIGLIVSLILLITFTSSCNDKTEIISSEPQKSDADFAIVIYDDSVIRIDPIIYSAKVSQLAKGEKIRIIEKSRGKNWVGNNSDYWYKIKLEKGITGWVFGKNLKVFSKDSGSSIDSYVSDVMEAESHRVKEDLIGKWWSVDRLGNFTDHGLDIIKDGTYVSYKKKKGKKIKGEFTLVVRDKEIIFLNGTSFGKNLKYARRGVHYIMEYRPKNYTKLKKYVNPYKKDELKKKDKPENIEEVGIKFRRLHWDDEEEKKWDKYHFEK